MGDEIILKRIEIIYGGLIQIDFKNMETKKSSRCFIKPKDFFKMFGEAMQKNMEDS